MRIEQIAVLLSRVGESTLRHDPGSAAWREKPLCGDAGAIALNRIRNSDWR
jgi:hypothetical protein